MKIVFFLIALTANNNVSNIIGTFDSKKLCEDSIETWPIKNIIVRDKYIMEGCFSSDGIKDIPGPVVLGDRIIH